MPIERSSARARRAPLQGAWGPGGHHEYTKGRPRTFGSDAGQGTAPSGGALADRLAGHIAARLREHVPDELVERIAGALRERVTRHRTPRRLRDEVLERLAATVRVAIAPRARPR